jgi:hypothetical protein
MNWTQIKCIVYLLAGVALISYALTVVATRRIGIRGAMASAGQELARGGTENERIERMGSGLKNELSGFLTSRAGLHRVLWGDAEAPLGDGKATGRVILTNGVGEELGIRLHYLDNGKFETLGFWNPGPFVVTSPTESGSTNAFAIYLVAEKVDRAIIAYGRGDWTRFQLAKEPIISEKDILSYNFANHTLVLTPEAAQRIPRRPLPEVPFIVMAGGQRIYLGVFNSMFSSSSTAVPTITVEEGTLGTNQQANSFLIKRAYAGPEFALGPDRRSDPRIRAALGAINFQKAE